MLQPEPSTFDFDALLSDISVATKDDEQKLQRRIKNTLLIKELVEAGSNLQKRKRAKFIKLSELEKDFAKLSNDHQQLLEKHIPMVKEFDVNSSRLLQLEADNAKLQIELDALHSHFIQMEAYAKNLEMEKETLSIEKNLVPQKSQTKCLKHVILFGKLAANKGKFSKKHEKLLKKYLQEAGEDEEAHDSDDKELDTIEMPPSCSSVDTGIGSSLMSEDEGWSPRVQFAQSSTYEVSPPNANESCDSDFKETIVEEATSSKVDTNTGHEKPLQSVHSTLANSTSLDTTETVGSSTKKNWTVNPKAGKHFVEGTVTSTKGDMYSSLMHAYSKSEPLAEFESSADTGATGSLSKALEEAITSTIETTNTCCVKPPENRNSKEKVSENQQGKNVLPTSTKSLEILLTQKIISVETNTNWIPEKVEEFESSADTGETASLSKALEEAITSTIEPTNTCYVKPPGNLNSKENVSENQQMKDVLPTSTKSVEHLQKPKRISVGTNTNWIIENVNSATSPIKCIDIIDNNYCESSPDLEIENILKEMVSAIKPISPLPPTPLNLRRNQKKKPVKVLYISQEMRKLQLENYKLNKVLWRQKKQLISANKILLKNFKSRKSLMSVDEDELVKLMLKINNKFQLVEREHTEPTNSCNSSQTGIQKDKCTKSIKPKHKNKLLHGKAYYNELKAEKIKKVHNKQHINNVLDLFGDDTSDIGESTNNTELSSRTSAPSTDEAKVNSTPNRSQIIIAETIDTNMRPEMENRDTHVQNVRLKIKRKTSKLEKLKKKLAPKLKISSEVRELRSKRNRKKIVVMNRHDRRRPLDTAVNCDKRLPHSENSSKDINNKEAYNKAVKIMTELKASERKSEDNCTLQNMHKSSMRNISIQNKDENNQNTEGLNMSILGQIACVENVNDKLKSEVVIRLQRLPLDTIQHDAEIFTFATIKNSSYKKTCTTKDEDQGWSKQISSEIIKSNTFNDNIEDTNCRELKPEVTHVTNILSPSIDKRSSITSSKLNSKTSQDSSSMNANPEYVQLEELPAKKRKLSNPENDKISTKKSPKIFSDKRASAKKSYCDLDNVAIPHEKCVYKVTNIDYNDIDIFDCDKNNEQLSTFPNNKDKIAHSTPSDFDKNKLNLNTKLKSLNDYTNIRTLRSHVRSTTDSDNHNLPVAVTNRMLKTRKSSSKSEERTASEKASLNKIEAIVSFCSDTTTTLKVKASTSKQYKGSKLINEDLITPIRNVSSNAESPKNINSIPEIISYEDMNMFASSENYVRDEIKLMPLEVNTKEHTVKKDNVYFKSMLSKYGRHKTHNAAPVSFPDVAITAIHNMLAIQLGGIFEVPTASDLDDLVSQLEKEHHKHFIVALLEFLMAANRDNDILCKTNTLRIPPMTKPEQALLYVLHKLQKKWPTVKLFTEIMRYIEFKLLRLSFTPSRNQVENLARFYAVICRFLRSRDLLRTFMVEAMYCMNYKAIPLIKQCLDVWMHAIPLAHLAEANTPIVQVLIHAIFYFRIEHHKSAEEVNALKFILSNKYSYDMKKFSEQDILQYLKNYISNVKDKITEQKALSTAFILIAKRKGVQWCQKHIVEGILMPLIKDKATSNCTKAFCICLLGSLLKPYPENMKLHCEVIINQLLLLMAESPSFAVEQAIMVSLILLRQHNKLRVMKMLTSWSPREEVCSELKEQIKIIIQEIPLHTWVAFLSSKP